MVDGEGVRVEVQSWITSGGARLDVDITGTLSGFQVVKLLERNCCS